MSVESAGQPNRRYDDLRLRLGFARLVTHYFSHAAWLSDNQLLADTDRLVEIPGVLIHGQLDLGSSLRTARQFAQSGLRARS